MQDELSAAIEKQQADEAAFNAETATLVEYLNTRQAAFDAQDAANRAEIERIKAGGA